MIILLTVIGAVIITVKVPTVDIIHIAIAVIINAVNRIIGVCPYLTGQILVGVHGSFIDYANVHRGRAGISRGPGFPGLAAIGVGGRSGVSVHPPQRAVRIIGIIGGSRMIQIVIGFGKNHIGRAPQNFNGGIHGHQHAYNRQTFPVAASIHSLGYYPLAYASANAFQCLKTFTGRDTRFKLYNQFTGYKLRPFALKPNGGGNRGVYGRVVFICRGKRRIIRATC